LLNHDLAAEFETPVDAIEVDAKRIAVKLLRDAKQWRDDADACVVKHDVGAAELIARGAHEILDRLRFSHIGRHEQAADGFRDLPAVAVGEIANNDLGAFLSKQLRRRPANPRRSTVIIAVLPAILP
jgi:hypothetical protein